MLERLLSNCQAHCDGYCIHILFSLTPIPLAPRYRLKGDTQLRIRLKALTSLCLRSVSTPSFPPSSGALANVHTPPPRPFHWVSHLALKAPGDGVSLPASAPHLMLSHLRLHPLCPRHFQVGSSPSLILRLCELFSLLLTLRPLPFPFPLLPASVKVCHIPSYLSHNISQIPPVKVKISLSQIGKRVAEAVHCLLQCALLKLFICGY